MSEPIKLAAMLAEDIPVLSAHIQDAVVKLGDISYEPGKGRLIMAMNRFVWENSKDKSAKTHERRRAILHFDHVTGLQQKNLKTAAPDAVLNLLALQFSEHDAPSGSIDLTFSGGGAMRINVECLEIRLTDLDAAWATTNLPSHDDQASE